MDCNFFSKRLTVVSCLPNHDGWKYVEDNPFQVET